MHLRWSSTRTFLFAVLHLNWQIFTPLPQLLPPNSKFLVDNQQSHSMNVQWTLQESSRWKLEVSGALPLLSRPTRNVDRHEKVCKFGSDYTNNSATVPKLAHKTYKTNPSACQWSYKYISFEQIFQVHTWGVGGEFITDRRWLRPGVTQRPPSPP